jgi:mannose/fructose/N-acetylgalactosamine-specific phosphotransferase system component IIB
MKVPFHVRVDNRLLHGQVVQFWIPHLGIEHLIVADDDIKSNSAMQAIYRMALPRIVDLTVVGVDELGEGLPPAGKTPTMLLIKTIANAEKILSMGISIPRLTIGNVHASPERERVTDAVYLSEAEVLSLAAMSQTGMAIEIQTFPGEVRRFLSPEKGGPGWGK